MLDEGFITERAKKLVLLKNKMLLSSIEEYSNTQFHNKWNFSILWLFGIKKMGEKL